MVRGIDSAVNGMEGIITYNDVVSNNLANINTPGFKSSKLVYKNIQDMAISQNSPNSNEQTYVGSLSAGGVVDSTLLDMKQGPIRTTGNPLDVAISGKGFFEVQTPSGTAYTRNGNFIKNADGFITTTDGYQVLGGNGPINIGATGKTSNDVNITEDGSVYVDKNQIDKLQVVDFKNPEALQSIGNSLLEPAGNVKPITATNYQINQGAIEQGNGNTIECMVNTIQGSRTYETLAKIIEATEKTLSKSVNEVGKLKV